MNFAYIPTDEVPETLYHYTSLEALVSIVRSKRLRASNIRFLNDRSESVRLRESVIAVLNEHPDQRHPEMVRRIVDRLEASPPLASFVASFSDKKDQLSQWRAYCPTGLGVSIGFRSEALNEQWVANPRGGQPFFLSSALQKVRYYSSVHQKDLEDMVLRLLEVESRAESDTPVKINLEALSTILPVFQTPQSEAVGADVEILETALKANNEAEGNLGAAEYVPGSTLAAWTLMLAPFVKHDAFEEESEWRKLISKDYRLMPGQQFRQGKSTLVPFVEIMLDVMRAGAECVQRDKYFINDVVVGPTPTPELTSEALRSLFDSEGHPEVEVHQSRIPYKDW